MQRIPGPIVLGAVALALAGCDLSTDLPTTRRVGVININQYGVGDTAKIGVTGVFFQPPSGVGFAPPNSNIIADTCGVTPYQPPSQSPLQKYDNLNAGAAIRMTTDQVDTVLKPVTNSVGTVVYVVPGGGFIPSTPGTDVTFDIPGDTGGFPAKTIRVRTLLPVTLSPVERHPEQQLHLAWSPAGSPSGALNLQMTYSSDSSLSPDRALNCSLRDDGSFDIPAFTVVEWAAALDESQDITGLRWATLIQSQQDVLMDVITQIQVENPPLTEPDSASADVRAGAGS